MSLKKFKALDAQHQQALLDAALKAAAYERKLIRDNEAKQLASLKEQGMVVSEVNKSVFVEAMAPVYDQFGKKYPGWQAVLEKIRAAQ
jgi:TRAP-type C4-dicarboxylate transport system substrate-binding protein